VTKISRFFFGTKIAKSSYAIPREQKCNYSSFNKARKMFARGGYMAYMHHQSIVNVDPERKLLFPLHFPNINVLEFLYQCSTRFKIFRKKKKHIIMNIKNENHLPEMF